MYLKKNGNTATLGSVLAETQARYFYKYFRIITACVSYFSL